MTTPPPIKISDEMIETASEAIASVTIRPRADIVRVALEAAAPLIAAQVLRQDQERIEWGVRWHGIDVVHGRGGNGSELYDEASARATAAEYPNAVAVYRRVAGPWIEAENGRERSPAEGDAEAWASGRLVHTDECQIHKTPPAGWPFDGFSCNCRGVDAEEIDCDSCAAGDCDGGNVLGPGRSLTEDAP